MSELCEFGRDRFVDSVLRRPDFYPSFYLFLYRMMMGMCSEKKNTGFVLSLERLWFVVALK